MQPTTFVAQFANWVPQRAAADYLGVSERTLLRWRKAGYLSLGDHYVRKFPTPNSPVVYCLSRCEEQRNKVFTAAALELAK
jgi:predicted site-specific integrase-resolvase